MLPRITTFVPVLLPPLFLTLLLVTFSQPIAAEQTDINQNNFVRFKWCAWGQWSRCSAARCPRRISASLQQPNSNNPDTDDDRIDPELSYCVVRTSNNSRRPAKAMIQESQGTKRVPFVAVKVRYRKCCPYFGLLNIFRLGLREECRRGQLDYQCNECYTNETIFLTRDQDDKPLPYCTRDSGSLQLAKILGSIAAAIILICLLACLVRLIVKYAFRRRPDPSQPTTRSGTPRSANSNQRRSRSGGAMISHPSAAGATEDESALHYLFFDRGERGDERTNAGHPAYDLPPAYKDVVKLPWIGFAPHATNNTNNADCQGNEWTIQPGTGPNPMPHRFSCAIYDPDQLASSSQTLGPQNPGATPLPPSYEEIVNATTGLGRMTNVQQPTEEIALEDRRTTTTESTGIRPNSVQPSAPSLQQQQPPPPHQQQLSPSSTIATTPGTVDQTSPPQGGNLPPSIVQASTP